MSENIGLVDPQVIYKWTVEESCMRAKKIGEKLESPVIILSDTKQCTIKLYPKGKKEAYQDYLSIFLRLVKGEFEGRVQFSILDKEEQRVKSKMSSKRVFHTRERSWGFPKFIAYNQLMQQNLLIPSPGTIEKKITFVCEFISDSGTKRGPSLVFEREVRLRELDRFEDLLDNKQFSDIVITVEGKNFYGHKNILSAKSNVFLAMFTHEMRENQQGSVTIKDFTYNVMYELFRFIYCGRVENLQDIAMDLLVAADKYLVDGLKSICERHLMKNINCDNVFEYLNFANSKNASALKDSTVKFFKSNLKDIVVRQPNFKLSELDKDIVDEIYRVMADRLKN